MYFRLKDGRILKEMEMVFTQEEYDLLKTIPFGEVYLISISDISSTSDSIIDLVQKDDLVENYDGTLIRVDTIEPFKGNIVYTNNVNFLVSSQYVIAIYTKDKQGNYILRWERE